MAARQFGREPWRHSAGRLKACPDGGFALPGSAACARLSGTLEMQTVLGTSSRPAPAASPAHRFWHGEQVRGRISMDVRTPTELGPLRLYTSVRVNAAPPDVLHR